MQATCTIFQELKERTRTYHDQVEQNFYTASIMNGTISLKDYVTLLQKFYGFYKPLEEQIMRHPEWKNYRFDIGERKKVALLEKDLLFLGTSRSQIERLPQCTQLPALADFAAILGTMYVLEGATLGGQVLLKQLKKHFQFTENAGAGFFNSYGKPELGLKWEEFRTLLVAYVQDHKKEAVVIAAACETFKSIDQWLARPMGNER